ncbi:MAG: AMP-binding protein, partial [Chitinivibrionales bacterium]|nr:AMP-binding protein [Chitinivibrionales bacterium]
ALALIEDGRITDLTVSAALLPYDHLFGLQTGVLTPAASGGSLLIEDLSDLRRIRSIVAAMSAAQVRRVYTVPMLFYLLTKVPETAQLAESVECFVSGACKLPVGTSELFRRRTNRDIQEGYGLTEASPICTWHAPGTKTKVDSVGKPLRCCEVAIRHEGQEGCVGVGRVCVKGSNVMKGYYRNPLTNARAMRDGWLDTGDIGRLDSDGYLYLTGLSKRMYNVGGRKIYPAHVQRLIAMLPGVRNVEVREAGDDTHALNTRSLTCVVQTERGNTMSASDIMGWCRRNLSPHKVPAEVEVLNCRTD